MKHWSKGRSFANGFSTSVAATRALGLDYAGVDLIPNPDDAARPLVLEVNGVAAWRGLQSVTPFDIAGALADDLLSRRMGLPALPGNAAAIAALR